MAGKGNTKENFHNFDYKGLKAITVYIGYPYVNSCNLGPGCEKSEKSQGETLKKEPQGLTLLLGYRLHDSRYMAYAASLKFSLMAFKI